MHQANHHNVRILHLFILLTGVVNGRNEWESPEEFFNTLPSTLLPVSEYPSTTLSGCILTCELSPTCSSFAYSAAIKTCRIYYHPTLMKPLPSLAPDPLQRGFQMYYKAYFCPPPWNSDLQNLLCYYVPSSLPITRSAAWKICEDNFLSVLPTFQTPAERDAAYTILAASNGSANSKFWLGYAQFDDLFWPRPVEEVRGYIVRRGDCPFNDLTPGLLVKSVQECAALCDRHYRDSCVGFGFVRSTTAAVNCWPKMALCLRTSGHALSTEHYVYDKVHEGRPPNRWLATAVTNGPPVLPSLAASEIECMEGCMKSYPDTVSIVFDFQLATGSSPMSYCWCSNFMGRNTKYSIGSQTTRDIMPDINDPPCLYGVRHRDLCLVFIDWYTAYYGIGPQLVTPADTICRQMGGKLVRPTDQTTKFPKLSQPFQKWAQTGYPGSWSWAALTDYVFYSGSTQWTTLYSGMNLTDPIYDTLPIGGSCEINGNYGNGQCGTFTSNNNGASASLWPCNCGSYYFPQFCELPISQAMPKTCRFTPVGREYNGRADFTGITNSPCTAWTNSPNVASYTDFTAGNSTRIFSDGYTAGVTACRAPDERNGDNGPFCYTNATYWETCNIPMCAESDWHPLQTYSDSSQPYSAITQYYSTQENGRYFDWTVEKVTQVAAPICQMKMSSWCPYYFRGHCYQLYTSSYNWTQASSVCQAIGWHLVTITDIEEHAFVKRNLLMNLGKQWMIPSKVWVGMTYVNSTWTWVTGESPTFMNTMIGSGSATPGSSGYNYMSIDTWYDANSGKVFSQTATFLTWFICEIDLAS